MERVKMKAVFGVSTFQMNEEKKEEKKEEKTSNLKDFFGISNKKSENANKEKNDININNNINNKQENNNNKSNPNEKDQKKMNLNDFFGVPNKKAESIKKENVDNIIKNENKDNNKNEEIINENNAKLKDFVILKNEQPLNEATNVENKISDKMKGIFGANSQTFENIIWIDSNIKENKNNELLKYCKSKLAKYSFELCSSNKEAFAIIERDQKYSFNLFYVVIIGDLGEEYIKLYSQKINQINIISANIIFHQNPEKFKDNPNLQDKSLNPGGIVSDKDEIIKFITSFNGNYLNVIKEKKIEENIFIYTNKLSDIALPFLLPMIFNNDLIDQAKIKNVQFFFEKAYPDVKDYINPSKNKFSEISYVILAKFFIRMCTLKTQFYQDMNKILTTEGGFDLYRQYIIILYTALHQGSIYSFYNEKLYRDDYLSHEEFIHLMNEFGKKEKNIKKEKINVVLFYTKKFLSFTKSETLCDEQIYDNQTNIPVKFIIEKPPYTGILSGNIDAEKLSKYPNQKEVIFLPFSCFEINDIKDITIKGISVKQISLKYLRGYKRDLNEYLQKNNSYERKNLITESLENLYGKALLREFDKQSEELIDIYNKCIKQMVDNNLSLNNNILQYYNWSEFTLVYENPTQKKIKLFGNTNNWLMDTFYKLYKDKCKIKIDNDVINFCEKYEFSNLGRHEIKLLVKEKILNLSGLFYECKDLVDISSLGNLDVSNCMDFSHMFNGCTSLTNINGLSKWKVTMGKNYNFMFNNCSSLENLNGLSTWRVENGKDFSCMFFNCSSLKDLNGIANWKIEYGSNFSCMFSNCTALDNLTPISNWKFLNISSFVCMFAFCIRLNNLAPLDKWKVESKSDFDDMFQGCPGTINASRSIKKKFHIS